MSRLRLTDQTRPTGRRPILSGLVALTLLSMIASSALVARPAAVLAQDDALATAAVTPEDALAYVGLTLDTESAQWQQGAALLERAGFGTTLQDLQDEVLGDAGGTAILREVFLGGEGALVVTDAALQAAADLDVTGLDAVLPEGSPVAGDGAPEATGVAFVLQPRTPGTAFAAVQQALQEQAVEEGAQVTTSEYQGVTIEFAPGGVADDNNFPLAIAQLGDFVLLGGSPTDLEPIIDTSQGTTPSLADFAPFASVRNELGPEEFLLYAFVNGEAAGEAQTGANATVGVFADTAGTDQYNGIVVRADAPGFRMETVTIPAEGAQLEPAAPAFDPALLARVPSETLFFVDAFDLGRTGILDALGLLLIQAVTGSLGGAATPVADQTSEDFLASQYELAAGLLGFNFRTDVIQQLIGEYAVALSGDADLNNLRALFVSDVADAGAITNALGSLSNLVEAGSGGSATVSTRQVGGADVTVVETTDETVQQIEYGVVEDRFLLGYGPAIDAFVNGPDASLADNEQFQTVMAELPADGRNGMLYVDLAQVIPLLQALDAANTGATGDAGGVVDADPACEEYASQEEAQAAYDEDIFANGALDQDFDGEACEDFFAPAAATAATPAAGIAAADFSAVRALGLVAFEGENLRRSSAILYIEE